MSSQIDHFFEKTMAWWQSNLRSKLNRWFWTPSNTLLHGTLIFDGHSESWIHPPDSERPRFYIHYVPDPGAGKNLKSTTKRNSNLSLRFFLELEKPKHSKSLRLLMQIGSPWVTMSHYESLCFIRSHHGSTYVMMGHDESKWVTMSHHESLWATMGHDESP